MRFRNYFWALVVPGFYLEIILSNFKYISFILDYAKDR